MNDFGRTCLVVCLLGICSLASAEESGSSFVDCDAGDDLATALAAADHYGGQVVRFRGTCVGKFVIESGATQLRGEGPGVSILQGIEFHPTLAITATDGNVLIRDLAIRGGSIGVWVPGPHSSLSILFSDITAINAGLLAQDNSRVFLNNTEVHGTQLAMQIEDHSTGTLFFSTVRDNTIAGVVVLEHSGLVVTTSEIIDNGFVGLNADRASVIEVDNSTLRGHVEVHAIAKDRSRLQIRSNTIVGVRDDPAQLAIGVDELSELQINDEVTVHGDLYGSNSSYMRSATSTIHGSVFLSEFSNFRLFWGEVDGRVECRKGADAYCDFGAITTTDGCMSAKPVCRPGLTVSRDPAALRIEQLRKRIYEVAPRGIELPKPAAIPKK